MEIQGETFRSTHAPYHMLRMCMWQYCCAPADWDDTSGTIKRWFCGPHAAIEAVNRYIAEGKVEELGISYAGVSDGMA